MPNIPQINDGAADPGLRDVIERAKVTKSPPPAWYRTMGNNPEVAKAFAHYWDCCTAAAQCLMKSRNWRASRSRRS
jgi:hypothetical protein